MPLPVPPEPVLVAQVARAGDLVLALDRGGLYVVDAAPRVRARLELPFPATGLVASGTHALVVGDGPALAWIDIADPDAPTLLRTGTIEGGARLVSTWNVGDDAWLALAVDTAEDSVAGTLRWIDPATGQPSPVPLGLEPGAGALTALVHVELADATTPLSASGAWAALTHVTPDSAGAWVGFPDGIGRAELPGDGPPIWRAWGPVAPPTPDATVAAELAEPSVLRRFWTVGDHVELTTIAPDGRGGLWTRERMPAGDGRFVDAARAGDRLDVLTVDAGDVWARTTLTPSGRETRRGLPLDERHLHDPPAVHLDDGQLVIGARRILLEALRRPLPADVACVASPRPPPMPPPTLGSSIVLMGDVTVARRPGTDELWRVTTKTSAAVATRASGLWRVGDRVMAMVDGGQKLVLLDRDLSHVERTVALVGNVVDVEVSAAGAWVLLRTGDGACGSSLVFAPADPDAASRTYGLTGRPVDLALHGDDVVIALDTDEGGLVATVDAAGETRARFAATARPVGLTAAPDGIHLAWARAGSGTAISVLDPDTFVDAPATALEPAAADRAWLTGGETVWTRGDTLCDVSAGALACLPSAAPDEVLSFAGHAWLRFGDSLRHFVDGQLSPVASPELSARYCAAQADRRCKARKGDIDAPAAFAVDAGRLAVLDATGVSVRDLRSGSTRLRFRFPE